MKIMDENGRLFGRISIIDVLAILVVLFMAVALLISQAQNLSLEEEETITFQVRVEGMEPHVVDAIHVGDSVYDEGYSSGGRGIGEITAVEVERDPGTILTDLFIDGTLAYAEAEDTVNLLVTVEGKGTRDEKGCTLNQVYALGYNAYRTFYTKSVVFNGMVCEIF